MDEVTAFSGIMNGTTNYIVDAMRREGAEFADVLAEAQRLGYAERDPLRRHRRRGRGQQDHHLGLRGL